jgi:uncharacterized protein (DUF2267 family)
MTGATANLPDLHDATNASHNAQSGLTGFLSVAQGLISGSSDSPLNAVTGALGGLQGALNIDVSGISERLPQAITTIENALPPDTLRFVEEIQHDYQQVSDFLTHSALVQQIHAGASLEQTALALVHDVLDIFQTRVQSLGAALVDAPTLDRITEALHTIETLASGAPLPADQLLEFLSQNLLGIPSDLLHGANTHVGSALAVLDPFSGASIEARIAISRDALLQAYKDVGQALNTFNPDDLAGYAPLEAQLQTLQTVMGAAFDAMEALYGVLTTAVAAPEWDDLFHAYAAVLDAIHLEDVPTIDDAVEALAGVIESMLARLTMSLSPQDLAAQVQRVSGSIHDLFAQSPLGQVHQIILDFIGSIQSALEGVPTDQVQQAVEGMLQRVHQELDQLGISQVRTTIQNGFQAAEDFVDQHLGNDLVSGVSTELASALQQFQNIPIADLGQSLATAIQSAGQVIQDLETNLSSGLQEVDTLLATLDTLDFRPAADAVIDEIDALKAKLQAIKPESLSDVEKVAIQAALSILRAIDLEGMIENELKKGFNTLDDELAQGIQTILDAWLEFRRRIGGLDASSLAGPILGLLDQVGNAVKGLNGTMAIAPLQHLVDALVGQLQALSPEAILNPLQAPYDSMMQTIQKANPDVWVQPLRLLHAEIDRLINLVDITPLLTTLEQKEKDLFAQAQKAISDALDAIHLPAPLDTFKDQMKALVLALTDALFGDPDGTLHQFSLSLSTNVRPSTLFQPLDLAFDRLMAMIDALPADQLVAALEAIRQGIGAALPVLNPANILSAMRQAQGRLAALSPASLPGTVTLPGLRASLAAQLSLSTANGDAKASLLARFDLVIAPLDVTVDSSRIQQLSVAHQGLVAALRQRINALDASGAQASFQRLDAGLQRILPAFLVQSAPLDGAAVHAGLATLRPSTKARRIDLAVDHFLAQLAPLQSALDGAVGGFFQEIRNAALVIHPGSLKDAVSGVYTTLRAKLHVLDPDELAASLKANVWDPLMDPLQAINPSALKAQLHALYQNIVDKLAGLVNGLLDQIRQAVDAFLAQIRQALTQVLDALKTQIEQILASVTALLAQLDHLVVDGLFHRLLNLLDNLKTSFDQELDRVRNEFDAMLDAIPLGSSASAGVSS